MKNLSQNFDAFAEALNNSKWKMFFIKDSIFFFYGDFANAVQLIFLVQINIPENSNSKLITLKWIRNKAIKS